MRIQPHPYAPPMALILLAGLIFSFTGCGPREAPSPPVSTAPSPQPPETKPEAGTPAAPAQGATAKGAPPSAPSAAKPAPLAGAAVVKATPAAVPVATTPPPAPTAKPAAPVQAAISDPGGEIAVQPTKSGLAQVGAAACKLCHKLQFASWSATAHAKRSPPLDCEGCHGPGSEYKAIAAMKDPTKAKAAGLVRPGAPFCVTCHKRGWNDGMLKQAHAHKT